MPEFCTCGAELPPDARFCHKCGKPQREEPLFQESLAGGLNLPPPTTLPAPPPMEEINFHNRSALKISFLAGFLGFLLSSLPFPPPLRFLVLLGAGFFAAYLYVRRSGRRLSVPNGARIGWISGLFCFVIVTVLFTVSFSLLSVVLKEGGMMDLYRQQLKAMGLSEEKIQEVSQILRNPLAMLLTLFQVFVFSTLLSTLGGMLGAKLLGKE